MPTYGSSSSVIFHTSTSREQRNVGNLRLNQMAPFPDCGRISLSPAQRPLTHSLRDTVNCDQVSVISKSFGDWPPRLPLLSQPLTKLLQAIKAGAPSRKMQENEPWLSNQSLIAPAPLGGWQK